jgi:hypothetical protein
LIFHFAW